MLKVKAIKKNHREKRATLKWSLHSLPSPLPLEAFADLECKQSSQMSSSQVNIAAASQRPGLIGVQDGSPGLQAKRNDFGEKRTIEERDIPSIRKFFSAIC